MKSKLMQTLLIIILVPAGLYLFFRWFERTNVWIPRSTFVAQPATVGLKHEDVYFETSDGVRLHGWYIPAKEAVASMLFMHGNGGNLSYRVESLRQFHSINLNVFIFDYRGYGKSGGWLSEQGTYIDAQAAYEWLKNKTTELPIILFGRSLGGAIAADLGTKVEADALIVESCFSSIPDIGAEIFPILPVRWISAIQYDAKNKIKNVNMPVLVVHSRDDTLIPYHHGKTIYENAPEPKKMMNIQGGHNEGYLLSEEKYLEGIHSFLDQHVFKTAAMEES